MNDSRNKPNEAEDQIPRGLHGEVADGKPSVLHLSYEAEGKLYFFTQEISNSVRADLLAAGWTPPDASLDDIPGIPWPRATASAPTPHLSGVDWHGLALNLESEAQCATSQTMQRAMDAAAHGLRQMGQHGAVPLHPVLLEAEAALEVAVARVEQAHPGATRTSEHLGLAAVRAALAGQPRPAGVQLASSRENRIYVAGPMTGFPEFNFPAFHSATAELRGQGLQVANPAEHGIVEGAEWADYLHYDLARLSTCSSIYLLPGWSKSGGAALEAICAHTLGMGFRYAEGAECVQLVDALHVVRALAGDEEIAPESNTTTAPGRLDAAILDAQPVVFGMDMGGATDATVIGLTYAARDVLLERIRQVEQEGWAPSHDDEHADGSLALAASCYACAGANLDDAARDWPWDQDWFKPGDARRNLVKAGALVLAELERLDRAAEAKGGPMRMAKPSAEGVAA